VHWYYRESENYTREPITTMRNKKISMDNGDDQGNYDITLHSFHIGDSGYYDCVIADGLAMHSYHVTVTGEYLFEDSLTKYYLLMFLLITAM